MSRPAHRRRILAAVLASAALLSACTADADGGAATRSATAPESAGAASPVPTATPAVSPDAAQTAAQDAVAAAVTASTDVSAGGPAARAKAFTGPALVSANAAAKVLPARTEGEKADAAVSPTGVTVLAVSRAGETPAQIVARTTLTKSGAPVLALLTSSTAAGAYQVAALTPVLQGATIDPFDPTADGSPAIGDAAGLVAAPAEVMASFATTVRFPQPATSKLLTVDPLTVQLRQSARAQSQALNSQGTFAQTFTPQRVLGGLRLAGDAGALVFTHLQRRDDVAYRSPQKLTPDKELTLLTGITQITTEANLTSNEMVAFVIPTSGQARVVAASDQIVAGSGR
jgi:hypothetical protein